VGGYVCMYEKEYFKRDYNLIMKTGYYMTIADHIYNMPRKCFIYVHKVCKKAFFYYFINDWQLVEKGGKTHLKINKLEKPNYRGKLADKEAFKFLNNSGTLILSDDCPKIN